MIDLYCWTTPKAHRRRLRSAILFIVIPAPACERFSEVTMKEVTHANPTL